ncbi:MAG: hypothetical protein NT092_13405 [Bacteroidia bacterium]|nr:hypothetical protein [Bacteroidia bacterium]
MISEANENEPLLMNDDGSMPRTGGVLTRLRLRQLASSPDNLFA